MRLVARKPPAPCCHALDAYMHSYLDFLRFRETCSHTHTCVFHMCVYVYITVQYVSNYIFTYIHTYSTTGSLCICLRRGLQFNGMSNRAPAGRARHAEGAQVCGGYGRKSLQGYSAQRRKVPIYELPSAIWPVGLSSAIFMDIGFYSGIL